MRPRLVSWSVLGVPPWLTCLHNIGPAEHFQSFGTPTDQNARQRDQFLLLWKYVEVCQ